MPVYRSDAREHEDWVEINQFSTFALARGGRRVLKPSLRREVIIVLTGSVLVECNQGRFSLNRNEWFELPTPGVTLDAVVPYELGPAVEIMQFSGLWKELYGVNVFQVRGESTVEMHYHDYHEYWLVFRGSGDATEFQMGGST